MDLTYGYSWLHPCGSFSVDALAVYALELHYSFLSVSDRGLAADHRSIRNSSCPAEIVDSDLLLIPPSLPASLQRFIPASTNLSQRMHRV